MMKVVKPRIASPSLHSSRFFSVNLTSSYGKILKKEIAKENLLEVAAKLQEKQEREKASGKFLDFESFIKIEKDIGRKKEHHRRLQEADENGVPLRKPKDKQKTEKEVFKIFGQVQEELFEEANNFAEDKNIIHTDYMNWLFSQKSELAASVGSEKQLTEFMTTKRSLPEIVLFGRSNVGKSSLLNALCGRSKTPLARISKFPGRTQTLNFYELRQTFRIVDFPGYGYARAPVEVIKHWGSLMLHYLTTSKSLKRVYVLIDGRHGIMKTDADPIFVLEKNNIPFQIVLTKVDQAQESHTTTIIDKLETVLGGCQNCVTPIIFTSANTKLGIPELRQSIISVCNLGKHFRPVNNTETADII